MAEVENGLQWRTEHWRSGNTILDSWLTAPGPNGEAFTIHTHYQRGQRKYMLAQGDRNIGLYEHVADAQTAAGEIASGRDDCA